MQRNAIAGQQVFLDRLPDERVAEPVLEPVAVGEQDVLGDGLARARQEVGARQPRGRFEESVIGRTTDDGGAAKHLLRGVGKPVDACEHDLAKGRWHRRPVVVVDREQLLGEEHVPVGTEKRSLDQVGRRLPADDRRDELADLVAVEAREIDALDVAGAVELGEQRAQRMTAMQVVRPVRPHQHDGGAAEAACEVREELAGRTIGPVQVFEYQQGRDPFRQPLEHPEQLLEQRAGHDAFARRRVELGHEGTELFAAGPDHSVEGGVVERAMERAQYLHDRAERQCPVGQVETLPHEHQRRFGDALDELGHQPGLTDTRFPGDEDDAGVLLGDGGLPGLLEPRQLGAATDKSRAGNAGRHSMQFGPGRFAVAAEFQRAHGVPGPLGRASVKRRSAWRPAAGAHRGGTRWSSPGASASGRGGGG